MTPAEVQALLQSDEPIQFQLQYVDQQLQRCQQDQQLQTHQFQQFESMYQQMPSVQQNQPMCLEFTSVGTTNDSMHTGYAATIYQRLSKIETQLTQNAERIEAVAGNVDQILKHTSRLDKMVMEFLNKSRKKSNVSCDNEHVVEHSDEFENMKKIETLEELKLFEGKLSNIEYEQKLIRFLRAKFTLDGNQNTATIFKEILRFLVVEASLFKPFSWAGQKRNGIKPLSFKENHTTFIDFMKRIVEFGQSSATGEHVEKLFENTLRFKNVIEQRDSVRAGAPRKFSERHRLRQSKNNIEQSNLEPKVMNISEKSQNSESSGRQHIEGKGVQMIP